MVEPSVETPGHAVACYIKRFVWIKSRQYTFPPTKRATASLNPVRQEALKLAETLPENAGGLNNASWTVVRQPGADAAAYQRALRQAEAACHLFPDSSYFLNTFGVAYYRVGKYREALAALEKSLPGLASNGVDAADLYFIAMCHYRLGDAAKARECFERAKDSHQRNAARLPMEQSEELKQFRMEAETLLGQPAATPAGSSGR